MKSIKAGKQNASRGKRERIEKDTTKRVEEFSIRGGILFADKNPLIETHGLYLRHVHL